MKKTTKVLLGVLVAVLVATASLFAVNPTFLKGQLPRFSADQASTLCTDGFHLVYSKQFPTTAEYKTFSSFYDAVKSGKLKSCYSYSVSIESSSTAEGEVVIGSFKCGNGFSTFASGQATAVLCSSGNADVELKPESGFLTYYFDGLSADSGYIRINSGHEYQVHATKK